MTSAALAKVLETLPHGGLDFEYCSIMQSETKTFEIRNPSNNLVQFEILTTSDQEGSNAFVIEPKMGKLRIFEFLAMLKAGAK